ncbi:MAG TPA: hypothetical protein VE640_02145 [Candidatus Bathyarchaeia archaeon]|nr:hypothetical protein [Candidatus Bathyarchaeia archaeon]
MNRERSPRSSGRSSRAPRIRPSRTTRRPRSFDHRRPVAGSGNGAILSFLSEVLIGDSAWTLAEVRRLVAVRELAELGRWRAAGLDDEGATAS